MAITTDRGRYRLAQTAPRVRRVLPPNPIFVDTVAGAAGNPGTAASPVNGLAAAAALCAGLDWEVEVIRRPANPLREEFIYDSTASLHIRGHDGEPWLIYASDLLDDTGWTSHGAGVYSKACTFTAVEAVGVIGLTETISGRVYDLKLWPTTGAANAPGVQELGLTGGRLYVHLPGDQPPAGLAFEVSRRNSCIATQGTGKLTLENADGRYGLVSIFRNGITGRQVGAGNLEAIECFMRYSGGNGIGGVGRSTLTRALRCLVERPSNDAYNLHGTVGISPTPELWVDDCEAYAPGDRAGQSSQGVSNHEETYSRVRGGTFKHATSGGMVVIDDATCDVLGDTEFGPVLIDANMRLGNTAGTIASQASCAWMDRSKGRVTPGVTVSNGGGRGVKVERDAGARVTGTELITSFGHAVTPDLL